MLIRSYGILAALICCTCFALAVEPPAPSPEHPKVIETKLPVNASYSVKLHPPIAQQKEKAIIRLPESVLRDLAAKLNDKRSNTFPIGGSSSHGTATPNLPHGATIMAGVALSLAMVSFIMIPRRRRATAWVAGTAALMLVCIVATNDSQANVPPPERFVPEIQVPQDQCLIVITPGNGDIEIFTTGQQK